MTDWNTKKAQPNPNPRYGVGGSTPELDKAPDFVKAPAPKSRKLPTKKGR